jgi:hypothetical protein
MDFNDHAYRRFIQRLKVRLTDLAMLIWYADLCNLPRIRWIQTVFYLQERWAFGQANIAICEIARPRRKILQVLGWTRVGCSSLVHWMLGYVLGNRVAVRPCSETRVILATKNSGRAK